MVTIHTVDKGGDGEGADGGTLLRSMRAHA
jgi:hypothetical protein